jgi:hypothetical protein
MFISALFGDMNVSFTPDGGLLFQAGRNGRLHVREPDGSVHGNHPYLSAVAVLRHIYPQAAWATAMRHSQDAGNTSPLAVVREAQQVLARQTATAPKRYASMSSNPSASQPFPCPETSSPAPATPAGGSRGQAVTGSSPGRPLDTTHGSDVLDLYLARIS